MNYLVIVAILLVAFLIGSIPTAFFVVKLITGKDLRNIGSGNLGGTNASRAANSNAQKYLIYFTTGFIDILKGALPVLFAVKLLQFKNIPMADKDLIYSITAVIAILGHDTMPFIKNGKGKGVATTFGAFLPIAPVPALIGLITFFILRIFTPVASRRSMASTIIIAIAAIIMKYPVWITAAAAISAMLIVITHKDNIKRIIRGEE
jgi:glycerol-3-phosphate acyltransferase PlsY